MKDEILFDRTGKRRVWGVEEYGYIDAAPMASFTTDVAALVEKITAAQSAAMDYAAARVLALGYTPADCLVEHHDVGGGTDRRDVLVVRGVPVFEVATKMTELQVAVTPLVLGWPAPVDALG